MKTIVLDHNVGEPFYCPFCGKKTISENKPFNIKSSLCKHLLYLGVTEGGLEYCSDKIKILITKFEDSPEEDDLRGLRIKNAIHFSLCEQAPSSFGVYVAYKK